MKSGHRRSRTVAVLTTAVLAALLTVATAGGPAGAASCAAPSATTHVDAQSGSDTNSGSASSPYRTIQRAVDRTPSGGTILVRGGDYRESVRIKDKTIHLVGHPDETVYLTGSEQISGWSRSDGRWRSDGTPASGLQENFGRIIGDRSIAGHLAQVYVNGRELEQVWSVDQVDADRFHVDSSGRVTIGTDPNGRYVEVSRRDVGVFFDNADNSSLTGFVVRRYATNNSDQGAIVIDAQSNGVTLRDLLVSDNSNLGAQILGDDVVVEHSTFEHNGRMGINADRADRLVVRHSRFVDNNDERFATDAAAAGVKITGTYGVELRDNAFDGNHADGVWIDVSSRWIDILANTFVDNERYGVHIEVSADVLIASNDIRGGTRGIQIGESNDVQIWNNVIRDAGIADDNSDNGEAIAILENYRDAAAGDYNPEFDPPYRDGRANHPFGDITWNVRDVTVRNNVLVNGERHWVAMLLVADARKVVSPNDMNVRAGHNRYHRDSPGSSNAPKWLVGWGDGVAFTSLNDWRAYGPNGDGSMETSGGLSLSASEGDGADLPSWIAARLGVNSDDIGLARTPSSQTGPRSCNDGGGGSGSGGSGSGSDAGSGGSGSGSGGSGGSSGGSGSSGATGPSAPLGSASFADVAAGSYFDQAVGWLVATGATTGTGPTTFSPDDPATRAQLATLLWRLEGSPSAPPGSATFADVVPGSYYDTAVGWLVATEATTGTSPSTFSPNDPATRAQLAALLWRLEGEPLNGGGSTRFRDVPRGAYYDAAVGWLVATEATTGTSSTTFSPDDLASRAQLATILWRLSWGS